MNGNILESDPLPFPWGVNSGYQIARSEKRRIESNQYHRNRLLFALHLLDSIPAFIFHSDASFETGMNTILWAISNFSANTTKELQQIVELFEPTLLKLCQYNWSEDGARLRMIIVENTVRIIRYLIDNEFRYENEIATNIITNPSQTHMESKLHNFSLTLLASSNGSSVHSTFEHSENANRQIQIISFRKLVMVLCVQVLKHIGNAYTVKRSVYQGGIVDEVQIINHRAILEWNSDLFELLNELSVCGIEEVEEIAKNVPTMNKSF